MLFILSRRPRVQLRELPVEGSTDNKYKKMKLTAMTMIVICV